MIDLVTERLALSAYSAESGPRRIGLIGFCFDQNSSFRFGAAEAPPLIREALYSASANLSSETGLDLGRVGVIVDAGDITPEAGKEILGTIESSISALLGQNLIPLSLGGDHSITYPIIRAITKRFPDLSILHIDAHPDLYEEFDGNRHSHASPFARIMEEGLVKRLLQIGIRTLNDHQREQAGRFGVEILGMNDWRDEFVPTFDSPVYVSVDLDGLDPAYAPGVSHLEPGGLTTRQVLNLIQKIKAPVIGADIVEFNPQMDVNGMTAMVCAKILKELAAKMLGSYTSE